MFSRSIVTPWKHNCPSLNMVTLQSVQLENSDSLSQGGTAVVHGVSIRTQDPMVEKELIL